MGRTFARITLASTNDFPPHKNDKIKGWVEHNGGTFSREITADVTHLVASTKAWKNYVPIVREARRLRTIHIVRLDWLEDSLLSKSRRPLDTTGYQFEQRKIHPRSKHSAGTQNVGTRAQEAGGDSDDGGVSLSRRERTMRLKAKKTKKWDSPGKLENKIEISAKEFDAECLQFERDMSAKSYRPFIDSNGFVYLLTLVRKDKLRERLEKHRVKVRYAPYFTMKHGTSYEIAHQKPHPRRKRSDPGPDPVQIHDVPFSSIEDLDARPITVRLEQCSEKPCLPPCPVPLYYFPKPYPYSAYPVLESARPRSLSTSNPHLRVHIPNPWAQSLQLFEHKRYGTGKAGDREIADPIKEYACYTIYSRPGHRHVETLAPPGSTFDFAWNMFQKIFKQKVGVDWDHRETQRNLMVKNDGGGDGTDEEGGETGNELWSCTGPLRLKQEGLFAADETLGGKQKNLPCATVVVNVTGIPDGNPGLLQAKTPEAGW